MVNAVSGRVKKQSVVLTILGDEVVTSMVLTINVRMMVSIEMSRPTLRMVPCTDDDVLGGIRVGVRMALCAASLRTGEELFRRLSMSLLFWLLGA